MAFAVAMNEWLTVTTSSPGPTPTASSARCSAVVQLETAQACGAPTAAANSRSKAATSGPCVTQPDEDHAARRLGLALVHPRPGDRESVRSVGCSRGILAPAPSCGRPRRSSSSSGDSSCVAIPVEQPLAGRRRAETSGAKPSSARAPRRIGVQPASTSPGRGSSCTTSAARPPRHGGDGDRQVVDGDLARRCRG